MEEDVDIVVDTNIFCQDYRMVSTNFRVFFDGIGSIPGRLKIPEIVIDEVVNRFREDLELVLAG
jgi:predicted nucleic acid-binding protein